MINTFLLSTSKIPARFRVVIVLPTPPLAAETQIVSPLFFIISPSIKNSLYHFPLFL